MIHSLFNFFIKLKQGARKNMSAINFKIFGFKTRCEIISVLDQLQILNFIVSFETDENTTWVDIVLHNDNESDTLLRNMLILAPKQGMVSFKLLKNFTRHYPYATGFIRTKFGIKTFQDSIKNKCGGQVLVIFN